MKGNLIMEKKNRKAEEFKTEEKRMEEGYTDSMAVDPAEKHVQDKDSKVQNQERNLAKGGNNSNIRQK
jgi:hypothetical protein